MCGNCKDARPLCVTRTKWRSFPRWREAAENMNDPIMVSVDWLTAHLNDPKVQLVDARVSDPRLPMGYRSSHIPGAVPLDLNRDVYEMAQGGPQMKSFDTIAKT